MSEPNLRTAMGLNLVLIVLITTGCAGPPRIAETASGYPEVTVSRTSMDAVSGRVMNRMLDEGFVLQEQTANSLLFTKTMEGGQAIMAQLAIGNSYSTTPQSEIRFTLASVPEGIRVIAQPAMSTQMAFGQVNRQNMNINNRWFNDLQTMLQQIEAEFEGP